MGQNGQTSNEPGVGTEIPGFVCDCAESARCACVGESFYRESEGKRYCVLHYPGKEKIVDFDRVFKKRLDDRNYNFRGVWFPSEIQQENVTFGANVDFSNTTFADCVDFSGSGFAATADFSNAVFEDQADFVSTRFQADCSFENAIFRSYTTFKSAQF